jgi:hypothetical protein
MTKLRSFAGDTVDDSALMAERAKGQMSTVTDNKVMSGDSTLMPINGDSAAMAVRW